MTRTALILVAFLWPGLAAAEFDYDYAQLGYVVGEMDTGGQANDIEESYGGWGAEASAGFLEHFFARGAYSNLNVEGGQGDIYTASAGLGARYPLNLGESTDVYGMLTHEAFDTYFAEGSGFGLTAGLRWQPREGTEFEPSLTYLDYGTVEEDSGNDVGDLDGWRLNIRGTFDISDNMAIVTDWRTYRLNLDADGGDADVELNSELRFGLRYYWR